MTQRAYHQFHPGIQFLLFICVTCVAILVGSLIGAGIVWAVYGLHALMDIMQMNVSSPESIRAVWILQIAGTTIPIGVIPVFFAKVVVRKEPGDYLKLNTNFPWLLLVMVFFTILMCLPVMEVLSNLNQHLSLPAPLKGIEQWMRDSEKAAEQMTTLLLKMDTVFDLVKVLLLVAALTAVVEELMFRGALLTIMIKWTRNHHAAIWITAALFSAFHMEFFGFLPRLMLGVFFGYFVYWSGSIWTSVWAHFINNGTAVVVAYLYQHKLVSVGPDDQHVFNYGAYVFSIIITVVLLFNYKLLAQRVQRQG